MPSASVVMGGNNLIDPGQITLIFIGLSFFNFPQARHQCKRFSTSQWSRFPLPPRDAAHSSSVRSTPRTTCCRASSIATPIWIPQGSARSIILTKTQIYLEPIEEASHLVGQIAYQCGGHSGRFGALGGVVASSALPRYVICLAGPLGNEMHIKEARFFVVAPSSHALLLTLAIASAITAVRAWPDTKAHRIYLHIPLPSDPLAWR
jgi:hypothetical protein